MKGGWAGCVFPWLGGCHVTAAHSGHGVATLAIASPSMQCVLLLPFVCTPLAVSYAHPWQFVCTSLAVRAAAIYVCTPLQYHGYCSIMSTPIIIIVIVTIINKIIIIIAIIINTPIAVSWVLQYHGYASNHKHLMPEAPHHGWMTDSQLHTPHGCTAHIPGLLPSHPFARSICVPLASRHSTICSVSYKPGFWFD